MEPTHINPQAIWQLWLLCAALIFATAGRADETLEGPAVPVPATYFGMHFHRAGDPTIVPAEGIGSWRLWDARVAWRYLDPNGSGLNFASLDRLVSLARSRHIDLLYTFGATPEWASARPAEKGPYGSGSAAEARDINDWLEYVRRTARRYQGNIRSYEIWNEPNGGFFTGDVQTLVEYGCAAASVLKEIDPSLTVVSPSGVGKYPYQLKWLEEFLARGGAACVDVIGYHLYAPTGTPESMLPSVRAVQSLMRKYGVADKPLWNTEAGWRLDLGPDKVPPIDPKWPKLDPELSAAYVSRALLIGWTAGLTRYYWYSWDHHDMGFVREDGRTTASAQAFLRTRRWLDGAIVKRCESRNVLWTCELIRNNSHSIVVWSEDTTLRQWQVPIGFISFETLSGQQNQIPVTRKILVDSQPRLVMQ